MTQDTSDEAKTKPHRPDRELLEELLALVRTQSRSFDEIPISFPQEPQNSALPYQVSPASWTFQQIAGKGREHNSEVAHITRLPAQGSENLIYAVKLKSGPFIMAEAPQIPDVAARLKNLIDSFENNLKHLSEKET